MLCYGIVMPGSWTSLWAYVTVTSLAIMTTYILLNHFKYSFADNSVQ